MTETSVVTPIDTTPAVCVPTQTAPSTVAPQQVQRSRATIALDRIDVALRRQEEPDVFNHAFTIAGILSWVLFVAFTLVLPDRVDFVVHGTGAVALLGAAVVVFWTIVYASTFTNTAFGQAARHRLARGNQWLLATGIWFVIWELTTAKSAALPRPYFTPPQEILYVFADDAGILASSVGNSLLLLGWGFLVGAVTGLITGLATGWSKIANYWVSPFIQVIGPVPILAWIPILFVVVPTGYIAAILLIGLSVWFPVSVLTRAGILAVPRAYYDAAQTLGANRRFLVFRISLPSALPDILTGFFMALGASFTSLTVVENLGVSSGLGWYINWQKGWGHYTSVYAGVLLLIVICSGFLWLLLRIRRHVLRWQKGLQRW